MFKLCIALLATGAYAGACSTTTCTYSGGHTHVYERRLNDDGSIRAPERWKCQKSGSGCSCTCAPSYNCELIHHHTSGYKRSFEHCATPSECHKISGSKSGRVATKLNFGGADVDVICDFGASKVELSHSVMSYKQNQGVESPGAGTVNINYDGGLATAKAFVDDHTGCGQSMDYRCWGSGVWNSGSPYNYFLDRNNNMAKMPCRGSPGGACDCDANDNTWRDDSGSFSASSLPIRAFKFGDTGDGGEKNQIRLSALKCDMKPPPGPATKCAHITGSKSGRVATKLSLGGTLTDVVCDFGAGKVELSHSVMSYKQNQGVESPGAGTVNINYDGGIAAAKHFVDNHSGCSQSMDYRCWGSGVWNSGSPYNYFLDRNNNMAKMPCRGSPGGACDCDANDNTWRDDSGSFSASSLPIRAFKFGDTGDGGEKNQIRLSALKCTM